MCAWEHVHMNQVSTEARSRGYRRGTRVVGTPLLWMLGIKLCSSVKAVYVFWTSNPPLSPNPLLMLEEVIWPLWSHLVHHQIPKDRWSYLSQVKITEVLWGKTESFSTSSDGPTLKPTFHGHEWADNVISQGNPTISVENSLWMERVSVLHLRSPTCPSW